MKSYSITILANENVLSNCSVLFSIFYKTIFESSSFVHLGILVVRGVRL